MDCTLRMQMGTKVILCYLQQMPKDMVLLENGQYIIKMKQFLPLLLVHKGRSPPLPKDQSVPPGTPFLPRRVSLPDDVRLRREALTAPHHQHPRRRLQYDEDEEEPNKENLPPEVVDQERRDNDRKKFLLQYLLTKLEEEIQLFQEQILHDLSDLRKKLEIPQ
ncbi:E4 [Gammapapillomavirus 18]|uniref:E4 n=2 Tax=Papillomaviridae TaxID=151340 RepID=A0A2D2ALV7_9PAPI|nr:E4 [Gammapapillomavirus 18]AYA94196.1 MAG: E4 protein [Human papillomavirus]